MAVWALHQPFRIKCHKIGLDHIISLCGFHFDREHWQHTAIFTGPCTATCCVRDGHWFWCLRCHSFIYVKYSRWFFMLWWFCLHSSHFNLASQLQLMQTAKTHYLFLQQKHFVHMSLPLKLLPVFQWMNGGLVIIHCETWKVQPVSVPALSSLETLVCKPPRTHSHHHYYSIPPS